MSASQVWETLNSRHESVNGIWVGKNLREQLPSQKWSIDGSKAKSITTAIVEGEIASVAPGRAFYAKGGDAAGGTPMKFSDATAEWRTGVITIKVTRGVGDGIEGAKQIRVGIAAPGGDVSQATRFLNGVEKLGHVVAVLDSPGYYHEPDIYSIFMSGALLGSVDSSGNLAFPALGEEEDAYLGEIATFSELASADSKPKQERTFP